MSEANAGTDVMGMQTRAERSGKKWILNGQKIWISGGGLAEIFTVFAQTPVKDEVTGETYDWGAANYVRRDPARTCAHVVHVTSR